LPDFELISPYGSVRFLELKREGKDLEDGQKEFRAWCSGAASRMPWPGTWIIVPCLGGAGMHAIEACSPGKRY
jgi:hypothetical protein